MKKIIGWMLFAALLAACAPAAPTATPTPQVVLDTANLETRAVEFVEQMAAGKFAEATATFDAAMLQAAPADKLEAIWEQIQGQYGPFAAVTGTRQEAQAGYQIVYVTCQYQNSPVDVKVVFDSSGHIAGLFFQPAESAYTPPAYADPQKFSEQEVTIGSGEWAVPGTLTLPEGDGPFPAVVLVHGSGPNDRDESIYANKPFKDIAWGLASRGIAVLRYDKRTYVHADQFTSEMMESVTLDDETVDDALLAVALLRANPAIDPEQVFVLGHSLGGMALPRIGSRDSALAGLISLAGPSRPLEDVTLEQYQYLYGLDGEVSKEDQANLTILEQQVALVKSPDLSPDTPAQSLMLGIPAAYWLDLRDYHPAEVAAGLSMRMLILQGGRDYQVRAADLEGWQAALEGRPDVTCTLYPELNHLFIAGEGASTPQEYMVPGHVSQQVIEDIAAWILE